MQFKGQMQPSPPIFDSDGVYIQSFDADHNDDVVSTSRSNLSYRSKQLSAIMNNLTVSSYRKAKIMTKSSYSQEKRVECELQLKTLGLKSSLPSIEFQSPIFSHWGSGWLLKKYDVNSGNKILINNYHKVSLVTYDTSQLSYFIKSDILSDVDVFATCVVFHANCPDNLLYYYDLKGDAIGMYDYVKSAQIDSIALNGPQVTSLKSIGNLVAVGSNNKVLVYDIRCNRQAYKIQLQGEKFNPVTNIEVHDNRLLVASKSSVDLVCVRKNGIRQTISKTEGESSAGINKAKFCVNDSNKAVVGQVGGRSLHIYDIDDLASAPKTIELNKKLLSMDTDAQSGEISTIEGSSKLCLNFYSQKFGNILDSIRIDDETIDFELNKNKESCICFSDSKCSIYNLELSPIEVAKNIDIPTFD